MDQLANPRIEVRVWDLPTRLFHWALVATVSLALLTGFLAPAWWLGVHRIAGYFITALLIFRVIWWFFGFEYSRLSNLISAIRQLPAFLRALVKLAPPHTAGHNPAGSAMILAMIGALAMLSMTGLLIEGGQEKLGLLAGLLSFAAGSAAREIHEVLAILVLAMISIHVAGVGVETWLQKTPLIRGMITGYLPLPVAILAPYPKDSRPVKAILAMGLVGLAVLAASLWLLRLPPYGVAAMPDNPVYRSECGDCHNAFHPSLLPRTSWAAIMSGLGDHFGEDASLNAAKTAEIAAYLNHFASEAWDSEAANLLRRVSPAEPTRITASPAWVRRHQAIPLAVFASAAVKTRSNCAACHSDAASGRFDDQAIAIPPLDRKGQTP